MKDIWLNNELEDLLLVPCFDLTNLIPKNIQHSFNDVE